MQPSSANYRVWYFWFVHTRGQRILLAHLLVFLDAGIAFPNAEVRKQSALMMRKSWRLFFSNTHAFSQKEAKNTPRR